jgi:hypothetical protein
MEFYEHRLLGLGGAALAHTPLPSSGHADYAAVSYTWSPEYPRETIWVNGRALE